ncbi:hypothetical protein P3X46_013041 [Hevea brasiliensis]|uniref:Uncharacterized protein n=1 Tax=Hevea brasiliensis TaxID=3981 RepID=A0ABQ9M290_HEVBR|nr:hypothetical protein P3X46_013041 [Hevea brasiliensis]
MSSLSAIDVSPIRNEEVSSKAVVFCRHGLKASLYTSWTLEREVLSFLVQQRNLLRAKVKGLEETGSTLTMQISKLKQKCEDTKLKILN